MKSGSPYRKLALAAAIMAFAALICLSPLGAGIFVVLMISIVGIPIGILLMAIPPLALLLVLAAFFAFPFRRFGWAAVLLAFLPAGAVMYFAPFLLNRSADAEAFGLVAGDLDTRPAPFSGRSLAIFVKPRHDDDCLDFCQRALISGAVGTFIVARPQSWPEPDFSQEGTGYWLEERANCEPRKLRDNTRGYPVAQDEPSAAPAMRLLMASGKCLVSAPRKVADAEAALFFREMTEGRYHRDSLDPFHVPMRATRVSWYARENGVLTEKLRRTAVEYMTLQAPLIPGLTGGAELRMYAGLMRKTQKTGASEDSLKLDPLLEALGFDLSIETESIGKTRIASLEAALASAQAPDAATQALAADVFKALDTVDGDFGLAMRLLADARFEVPDNLHDYVRAAYKRGGKEGAQAMDAYFGRLETTLFPGSGFADDARTGRLRRLGSAAKNIPDEHFAREWPRLRKVLAEPLAYPGFEDVIRRAHLAGEAAHGDMLGLLDEAAGAEARKPLRKERYNARYYALYAICRMGQAGRPLIPELERRLADGTIRLGQGSEWEIVGRTLEAIGGDADRIRPHVRPFNDNPKNGEMLDKAIARAKSGRRC